MVEYQDGKHLWLILSWMWILPWPANLLYSVNLVKNKYMKVYKQNAVFKQRHFSVSYKVTTTLDGCRGCELRLESELSRSKTPAGHSHAGHCTQRPQDESTRLPVLCRPLHRAWDRHIQPLAATGHSWEGLRAARPGRFGSTVLCGKLRQKCLQHKGKLWLLLRGQNINPVWKQWQL